MNKECSDCLKLIIERDQAVEWADSLAYAMAVYFGREVGEHSNANSPWRNALELLEAARRPDPPTYTDSNGVEQKNRRNPKLNPWCCTCGAAYAPELDHYSNCVAVTGDRRGARPQLHWTERIGLFTHIREAWQLLRRGNGKTT